MKIYADGGAYPTIGSFLPFLTRTMSQGVYEIPKVEFNVVERGDEHHADRGVSRRGAPGGHGVPRADHRHRRR